MFIQAGTRVPSFPQETKSIERGFQYRYDAVSRSVAGLCARQFVLGSPSAGSGLSISPRHLLALGFLLLWQRCIDYEGPSAMILLRLASSTLVCFLF